MDHYSTHLLSFLFTVINLQGSSVLLVLLICLLFFSFMISGAEVAFFSLTYKDINLLKTKQLPVYTRILDLLENPKILLASLIIANSFINIGIIIISNILMDDLFYFSAGFDWILFIIKVIVVAVILLLFGEVMPKILANQNNIRFAKDVGPVVEFVHYIFKGLGKWLVKYSDFIERRLTKKTNGVITNEELYHAIDITDTGTNENEKNILKGILKFGNITAKEIMKTRLDVHGIDHDDSFETVLKQIREYHYSRMPVYKNDLDEVVGILHTKDIIEHLDKPTDFDWHILLRQPYFVHEQKLIEDLLKDFQLKRIHFAVVVDEFGGTSGIVTLEDILEEVIGEIKDEFDDEETGYKKIDNNNYIFEGRIMINDVCKIMELPDDTFDAWKGESDSLAGLILELARDIPKAGQIIFSGDFEFTVLEVLKNRVQKIKVSIKPQVSE